MNAATKQALATALAIITAELDVEAPASKPRKAAKAPKREISEAAAFCRDARLARRNAAENADNAKGLTKAEKSYLYHTYEDYAGAVTLFKALSAKKQAKVIAGELSL